MQIRSMSPARPDSVRVLTVGNSFSQDSMCYLWELLHRGGIPQITLGNLYYPGCSLAQHLEFARSRTPVRAYEKNTAGVWETRDGICLEDGVRDEDWDIIVFQQSSRTSGLADSYGQTLTDLLDLVEPLAPRAKFWWNMTWAYQSDSTHPSFPNYDCDQLKMYRMIVDCLERCIKPERRFVKIIPTGTAIQNARTSFLGDTLTRDGYHLNREFGRLIAGLTWFCALTGAPAEVPAYNPAPEHITRQMLAAAEEAVNNAIRAPECVTEGH